MKTTWIASKISRLLPLIMAAVLTLTTMGCGDDPEINYPERAQIPGPEYSGNILSQSFEVLPEGTSVDVFGGTVSLTFPEGAVTVPTDFNIYSFPIHHLDWGDFNMYNRGLWLEGDTPDQKIVNITMKFCYDLAPKNWKKAAPGPSVEKNLTIYQVSPNIHAYQRINSIGDCCVDCSCKIVKGCISGCGFYVVGEN